MDTASAQAHVRRIAGSAPTQANRLRGILMGMLAMAARYDAPPHTVVLPEFGVQALASLVNGAGGDAPVFANRDGGWMSLSNIRRALRVALPADLAWCTPHSFRRTVASVVRDAYGPALAQQQLSHAKLATTEAHYLQRQTRGPDVRDALERYAGGGPGV